MLCLCLGKLVKLSSLAEGLLDCLLRQCIRNVQYCTILDLITNAQADGNALAFQIPAAGNGKECPLMIMGRNGKEYSPL